MIIIFTWILFWSVRLTLVGLTCLAIEIGLNSRSATGRMIVMRTGLIAMVLLPFTAWLSSQSSVTIPIQVNSIKFEQSWKTAVHSFTNGTVAVQKIPQTYVPPSRTTLPDPVEVGSAIYLFVVIILITRWGILNLQVHRLRRKALKMDVGTAVFLSSDSYLSTPIAVGALKPVILFPHDANEWSSERVQVALTHEMAHIQARDGLWLQLMNLLCVIQWFNPMVWMVRSRALVIAEEAADEAVIRSGIRPSQYASVLLTFANPITPPLFTGISIAGNRRLNTRMKRILSTSPSASTSRVAIFTSILSLIGVTASASGLYLQSDHGGHPMQHPAAAGGRVDWSKAQFKVLHIKGLVNKVDEVWSVGGKKQTLSGTDMGGYNSTPAISFGDKRMLTVFIQARTPQKLSSPDQVSEVRFRVDHQAVSGSTGQSVDGNTLFMLPMIVVKSQKEAVIEWSTPEEPIITVAEGALDDKSLHIKTAVGPEIQQSRFMPSGVNKQEKFRQTIVTIEMPKKALGMVWEAQIQDTSDPNNHVSAGSMIPSAGSNLATFDVNIPREHIGKIRLVAWHQKWHSLGKIPLYPK